MKSSAVEMQPGDRGRGSKESGCFCFSCCCPHCLVVSSGCRGRGKKRESREGEEGGEEDKGRTGTRGLRERREQGKEEEE